MDKLLSIVIPTYNMERYLSKCLESLIVSEELMQVLEILVVNDGSKDSSSQIAHEFESKYPQTIRVIDKENGGHGSAWNRGVEEASGKFLRFLDSDDWLSNISAFMRYIAHYDVDLIFSDLNVFYQGENRHKLYSFEVMESERIYNVNSFDWMKTNNCFNGYNITNFHVCTYRTSLLKQCHPLFLEKMFYDDEILFVMPLCRAKSFAYFKGVLYNYLLGREGQTMDKNIVLRNIDFKIRIRKYEIEYVNSHPVNVPVIKEKLSYILNSRCNNTITLISNLPYKESRIKMKEWCDYLKCYYPDFKGGIRYRLYSILPFFAYRIIHEIYKSIK